VSNRCLSMKNYTIVSLSLSLFLPDHLFSIILVLSLYIFFIFIFGVYVLPFLFLSLIVFYFILFFFYFLFISVNSIKRQERESIHCFSIKNYKIYNF
jgi:hypothetical protein